MTGRTRPKRADELYGKTTGMRMNKKPVRFCLALLAPLSATAQVPAILIEACSLLESAPTRIECLQAANKTAESGARSYAPQPVYSAAPSSSSSGAVQLAPSPNSSFTAPSGRTCFVGPRGGTYTITKSGKKNYGGC